MSNHVNCPYAGSKLVQLPCQFISHPHDKNLMFCSSCGSNEYDLRTIGHNLPPWLLIVLGILLFILI